MEKTEKVSQLKRSVAIGIVFGVTMGAFYAFQDGAKAGLIGGPIAGALFGGFMYFFSKSGIVKRQTKIDENIDGIVYSGAANHFINKEGVGGKLYLLHDRLHFKSHRFNIQNHQLEIAINDIAEVTFIIPWAVPNGLLISTHNGHHEKFVVNNRKIWKEEILKVKSEGLVSVA